jgi:flavin reductase (DIM6/NTAB) family NADH-FMN oxidoreductase RutF
MQDLLQDLPFDQARFRQALGRFATGVAVVTGLAQDGARLGITVSSFNSVSLAPPLILFSIARRTNSFPAWQAARHYAVNILSEHQEALSDRFARPLADKWDGVETIAGRHGLPILQGALAVLECAAHARHDGGDHEIFVGRVEDLLIGTAPDRPLVFFSGRYRRLAAEGGAHAAPSDSLFPRSR